MNPHTIGFPEKTPIFAIFRTKNDIMMNCNPTLWFKLAALAVFAGGGMAATVKTTTPHRPLPS